MLFVHNNRRERRAQYSFVYFFSGLEFSQVLLVLKDFNGVWVGWQLRLHFYSKCNKLGHKISFYNFRFPPRPRQGGGGHRDTKNPTRLFLYDDWIYIFLC